MQNDAVFMCYVMGKCCLWCKFKTNGTWRTNVNSTCSDTTKENTTSDIQQMVEQRAKSNIWRKMQNKKNIQKKMTLLRPPNWILLFFKILFWTQSLTVNLNFKNEILTNIEFDSFVYIHCIPPLKEKMIIEQRDEHLLHVGISWERPSVS